MRQNARQILRVVKEAFTGQFFDNPAGISDSNCSQEESSRDIMSCRWSQVDRTHRPQDRANAAEVTRALTAVSMAQQTFSPQAKGPSL